MEAALRGGFFFVPLYPAPALDKTATGRAIAHDEEIKWGNATEARVVQGETRRYL